MKNKIFLTSIFALAFACPAFAVDGNATIENGDTCNVDNLGTSTNNDTANLEAIWTLDPRTCTAGQYYDATTNTCLTCEAGSFCGGGTFNVESNPNGGGTTLCSTLTGGYNSSDSGAGANTDCYKGCVASDVANATEVSGNVYYDPNNANGNKQCSATACAAGWHLEGGAPNLDASTSPTTSAIGFYRGNEYASVQTYHEPTYYGITGQREWGIDMGYGVIHGKARCSTVEGTNNGNQWTDPTITANLTDETGEQGAKYCYCQMDSYKASGSSTWQSAVSSWVFYSVSYSSFVCADYCANSCASYVGDNAGFRSALFGSITPSLATCEANNIGLAWYNDTVANNGTTITPNNSAANQCTYSGTITVPTNEMQKPGYTFGGWKLRTNN